MKRLTNCLICILLLLILNGELIFAQNSIAIKHVDIIGDKSKKSNMTVVISGNKITSVGRSNKVKIPKKAIIIEGRGKFLIPGLWDMHVHILRPERKELLPLFIQYGVTGIRDMGAGDIDLRTTWAKEIEEGMLNGPRIVATGPIVDGPLPMIPNSLSVKDETSARQAVQQLKAMGADFVKVYSLLPKPLLLAIVDEAQKQNLSVVGHVPEYISAFEAVGLMSSMEHLFGIPVSCSSKEEELRHNILDSLKKRNRQAFSIARRQAYLEATETYDPQKADRLFRQFVKNGTYHCPTLICFQGLVLSQKKDYIDEREKTLPAQEIKSWHTKGQEDPGLAATFLAYKRLVALMNKAGVQLLTGTDLLSPFCFPGSGVHDELQMLVAAGLSPREALQTATGNPARFLGIYDRAGSVEKGKLADLVLLEKDPTKNIRNTRAIRLVISNGKLSYPALR